MTRAQIIASLLGAGVLVFVATRRVSADEGGAATPTIPPIVPPDVVVPPIVTAPAPVEASVPMILLYPAEMYSAVPSSLYPNELWRNSHRLLTLQASDGVLAIGAPVAGWQRVRYPQRVLRRGGGTPGWIRADVLTPGRSEVGFPAPAPSTPPGFPGAPPPTPAATVVRPATGGLGGFKRGRWKG